jgi:hypothetical protein
MKRDAQLFIRTHRRDLDWLKVCLQSAQKFWASDYPPVVVATPDCEGAFPIEIKEMGASVFFEPQWPYRHAGTNYLGLSADLYSEAPMILITDSDCMFRMPVSAESFMQSDKIILRGEPWETVKDPVNQICIDTYRVFIKEGTGIWAAYETMRHHPFMYFREDFAGARNLIQKTTGLSTRAWLEKWSAEHQEGLLSEFNLMGAYCLNADRPYVVLPTILWDDQKIRQFHSWSQTPLSVWDQVSAILA